MNFIPGKFYICSRIDDLLMSSGEVAFRAGASYRATYEDRLCSEVAPTGHHLDCYSSSGERAEWLESFLAVEEDVLLDQLNSASHEKRISFCQRILNRLSELRKARAEPIPNDFPF